MSDKRRKSTSAGQRSGGNRAATGKPNSASTALRIIGGSMRGRPLTYHGDPRTRPMKDRVREAVFNLLGESVKGCHAIDLFAGTGALALEAISRGAIRATCVERHFPSARLIERNARELEVADRVDTVAGDTFIWALRHGGLAERATDATPWCVFCSPPYALFVDRRDDMLQLIEAVMQAAPPRSQLVVESDDQFDVETACPGVTWDVRRYAPAIVAIADIGSGNSAASQAT